MSVAVSKVGVVLCRASSKKSKDSIGGISLSQQMLAVIKHVVDDNIICLSATQLMHAQAHGVRNTVQQLLRKTLNFISFELWPQKARVELVLITRFTESKAAWIWVGSQQNFQKIIQRLVELWISSNNIWVKRCDIRVSVFCQVVQKHCLSKVEK